MYLTRPIFTFPVNWKNPVNKSFDYDLGANLLGYGAEFYTSEQLHVVQGFDVTLLLNTDDEIVAVDDFTAGLNGRLVGFWMPAPIEAVQIRAAVNNVSFDILSLGLASSWPQDAALHLYFQADGVAPAPAKVLSILDQGNGLERITLTAALADWETLFTPGAMVMRLHYVRLAEDTEKGKFIADGKQARNVRVMELPEEYSTFETGERKVYLYRFYANAPAQWEWRYTNFAAGIVFNNALYAKFEMEHGELSRSVEIDNEGVEITAKYDVNHPFSLFMPVAFSGPVFLQILEADLSDVASAQPIFVGRVLSAGDGEDGKIKGKCQSFGYMLQQNVPRHIIGPTCPYVVFDKLTCKLDRYRFETTATITAIDATALPATITATLNYPASSRFPQWTSDDYFAKGLLETGTGKTFEGRAVFNSSYDSDAHTLTLILNAPLFHAVVGQEMQLVPGCDGTQAMCEEKFNNDINSGRMPGVPEINPALTSVAAKVSSGGKGK